MKPELLLMADAIEVGRYSYKEPMDKAVKRVENVFLSALRWRGDQLWCGPICFGDIHPENHSGFSKDGWVDDITYHAAMNLGDVLHFCDEADAKAALEAAARKQINEWFEEQRG